MINTAKLSSDIRKRNFGLAFQHISHITCWLLCFVERCQRAKLIDKDDSFYTKKTISDMVWLKYPGICPYCGTNNCSCAYPGRVEKKDGSLKKSVKRINRPRTLDEWGVMFEEIYGGMHAIAPIEELAFHMFEETGEVANQIVRITEIINGKTKAEKRQDLYYELADVFSWVCSVVNKLNKTYFIPMVSHLEQRSGFPRGLGPETLSQIIWSEYGSSDGIHCPHCKSRPCACDKKMRLN